MCRATSMISGSDGGPQEGSSGQGQEIIRVIQPATLWPRFFTPAPDQTRPLTTLQTPPHRQARGRVRAGSAPTIGMGPPREHRRERIRAPHTPTSREGHAPPRPRAHPPSAGHGHSTVFPHQFECLPRKTDGKTTPHEKSPLHHVVAEGISSGGQAERRQPIKDGTASTNHGKSTSRRMMTKSEMIQGTAAR